MAKMSIASVQTDALDELRRIGVAAQREQIDAVLVRLLAEIRDTCADAGIECFLAGNTALGAYRDGAFMRNTYLAAMVVPIADFPHLISLLEARAAAGESRGIDYLLVNGRYPGFSLRYVDLATTDVHPDTFEKLRYNGISVCVYPICGVPKGVKLKVVRKMEALLAGKKVKVPGGRQVTLATIYERMPQRTERIGRFLYRRLFGALSAKTKGRRINGKEFKAGVFAGDPVQVSLGGEAFAVLPKVEQYLATAYEDWRTHEPEPSPRRVVSVDFGYDEVRSVLDELGGPQIERDLRGYHAANAKMKADNQVIQGAYAVLNRSNDRLLLYQELYPQKDRLQALRDAQDWAALDEVLADYLAALVKYEKKDLGLCFDAEIFDIAMDALANGESCPVAKGKRAEYLARLRKLVPADHWNPVVLRDWKGEVIS